MLDKTLLPEADADVIPLPDPEPLLPEEGIGPLEEDGSELPAAAPSSYFTKSARIGFAQMETSAAGDGGSATVEVEGGGVGGTERGDFPLSVLSQVN